MTAADDRAPATAARLEASDARIVLRHGEDAYGDQLNARDAWVWESGGRYFMHYDAAGSEGWLTALATSDDGITWRKHGTVLELGAPGAMDAASASYGSTFFDGSRWHMFYLGTPNATPDALRTPSFPYQTMKAEAMSPSGPWRKQQEVVPLRVEPGTWYADTASPGTIVERDGEYVMIFSGAATGADGRVRRTLGLARTRDLDGSWAIDPEPLLPPSEQIENSALYREPTTGVWFLFTNHVGVDEDRAAEPPQDSSEYTDAIWVYWSDDPTRYSRADKAVVIDARNASWSPLVVGLPSVLPIGDRLAVYFDGSPNDSISHGGRDIGVAWLPLPLSAPVPTRAQPPAVAPRPPR